MVEAGEPSRPYPQVRWQVGKRPIPAPPPIRPSYYRLTAQEHCPRTSAAAERQPNIKEVVLRYVSQGSRYAP